MRVGPKAPGLKGPFWTRGGFIRTPRPRDPIVSGRGSIRAMWGPHQWDLR